MNSTGKLLFISLPVLLVFTVLGLWGATSPDLLQNVEAEPSGMTGATGITDELTEGIKYKVEIHDGIEAQEILR